MGKLNTICILTKENYKTVICPECHVAAMRPHPEQPRFHGWLKCPLCGYTQKEKK